MLQEWIVSIEKIISNTTFSSNEKEEKISRIFQTLQQHMFSKAVEQVDKKQMSIMRAKGFRKKDERTKSICFSFGEITFSRSRYISGKETVYPVDECLGLEKRSGFSTSVWQKITEMNIICQSYRKTAEAINNIAPYFISKTTVLKAMERAGIIEKDYQTHLEESRLQQNKQVPFLVIEGDSLFIKQMNNKNPKKMTTKAEIPHFICHEGVKQTGKRKALVNIFETTGRTIEEAKRKMMDYIHFTYDLAETTVLTNSDMGVGYQFDTFQYLASNAKQHVHFLDQFHLKKKIIERLRFQKEYINEVYSLCLSVNYEKLVKKLFEIQKQAISENQKEEVEKLFSYIQRNWEYIKPFKHYNFSFSKQGIGICESSHRKIVYRMKNRGMIWGRNAITMAKCCIHQSAGTLNKILSQDWKKENILDDQIKKKKFKFREKRKIDLSKATLFDQKSVLDLSSCSKGTQNYWKRFTK